MTRRVLASISCVAVAALFAWSFNGKLVAQEAEAERPVELKVGDQAPEFEAVDDTGEPWKSIDHVGKKILVVYFYPKDQTPGCTKQGQCYRDAAPQLKEQGVEVVGVSRDNVASHEAFKKAENLNFTLLADVDGKVSKAFGVEQIKRGPLEMASRWTFVIDLEGHVAFKDDKVRPDQDVVNVMKVVAELKKKAA